MASGIYDTIIVQSSGGSNLLMFCPPNQEQVKQFKIQTWAEWEWVTIKKIDSAVFRLLFSTRDYYDLDC